MAPAVVTSLLTDPMVAFCAGCVVAPAVVSGAPFADVLAYFFDPWFLTALSIMAATVWATLASPRYNPDKKLTVWDQRVANWFLLNGGIIHFMMDGMVGTFHAWSLMDQQYRKLDKRFEFGEAAGTIVTGTEIFCMAPLALFTYRAYILQRPYRHTLAAWTSGLQFFGTVVFVGTEALTGFENVPFDWNLEFTFEYNFYFWFGFVFGNGVWLVVTVWITVATCLQQKRQFDALHDHSD